jgi:hypothetical protein
VNQFSNKSVSEEKNLITSNPIDLSQISRISKFRSCAGHNFSGYNVQGVRESNRSMKHYMTPIKELYDARGKVDIYAPFDGEIIISFSDGRSNLVIIDHPESDWNFIFFHIDLDEGLAVGSEIEAGQHIGSANTEGADNFDMAFEYETDGSIFGFITSKLLKFGYPPFYEQYDSVFNYMTAEVLSEFQEYGFEKEEFIITEEERNQNPCDFDGSPRNDDWVNLTDDFAFEGF